MHIVERFSVGDSDTLRYEFTLTDPESFAGPWAVAFSDPAFHRSGLRECMS